VPELELGEPPDEGSKLVVLFRGQRGAFTIFDTFVLRQTGVELGLEECKEEVEEVDAQTIGYDVPALGDDDAKEEGDEDGTGGRPTIGDVRRGFIEVGLVLPQQLVALCTDGVKRSGIRLGPVHVDSSG